MGEALKTAEKLRKGLSIFLSIEKNEKLKTKWMESVLKDWQREEVLKIAKSGGEYIGQPFRDKKGGHPFKKYREYEVPIGWSLGVWSGATLYALMKGMNAGGIRIIKKVDGESIEYGYNATHKYINFNVGVNKEWLRSQSEIMLGKVEKYINDNLRVIMK